MKAKKVKYKVGQLVYSYQNKTKKYPIIHIYRSGDSRYDHKYKLKLPDGSSNWIDESSIYLTKKKINGLPKGLSRLNGYVKNKTKQARKKRDTLIKKLKQAQALLNKKRKAAIKSYKRSVK